jgi:murein DD-endopeptidase MepM/ murein hydrolase activator NlpD
MLHLNVTPNDGAPSQRASTSGSMPGSMNQHTPPIIKTRTSDAPAPRPTLVGANRGASHGFGNLVDIGHEPPLDPNGQTNLDASRRAVNLRWLGGSILTALTGAALLGTAIYVAIEGGSTVPMLPERASPLAGAARPDGPQVARKGDLLVRTDLTVAAKNNFRAPITTRIGDRDVVRMRGFTRIATNLSPTAGRYATDIPAFNPLRLMSSEPTERIADIEPSMEDAELSVMKRDLTNFVINTTSPALTDGEAAAQVEEERRIAQQAGRRASVPIPAQMMLTRTLRKPAFGDVSSFAQVIDDPFDLIEVRVIPENVSILPKIQSRPPEAQFEELDLVLAAEQSLTDLLLKQGAAPAQASEVAAVLGGEKGLAALPAGLSARVLVAPGQRPGDPRRIMRVVLYGENGVEAIAAVDDEDTFVAVAIEDEDEEARIALARSEEAEASDQRGGARLYESLYETAFKHGLSKQTVEELVGIFAYDVDFQRRVASGDGLDVFLSRDDEDPDNVEILSAALSIGGETRRVYRFHSPEDGSIDFFDELGRSLKKFLLRKPITEGRMTSGFGNRRHPVLGYARMHTGVDWGARTGTPILASGNGRVTKAAWDGGYGRRVEIQHANGYVTSYSHMTRFATGIEPGTQVTQGQVIGYVGSTGLSTGPHLHYEVIVNGSFVDPLKIRVPRSQELDGFALAEFNRQREQINELIEKSGGPTRLAQTDLR